MQKRGLLENFYIMVYVIISSYRRSLESRYFQPKTFHFKAAAVVFGSIFSRFESHKPNHWEETVLFRQ